jgi:ABC-2 type transport system ATP-binding protein
VSARDRMPHSTPVSGPAARATAGPAAAGSMTEPPALVARRVSKWFGEVIAVNDCSLAIGPGVTGLLGLNGAGKTTLFKLLAGLIEPGQGEVLLRGRRLRREVGLFRRIGFCPESDALPDWLTGREFLRLMLRLMGFAGKEVTVRADRALVDLHLDDAADRRLGGYSKGMRQKLKLAQALAHEPDIVFLDEPLNGMDPVSRREIIDLARQLGAAGKTVLVSSHVLPEIEAMTRSIVLIHHGKVLAEGDVTEIRDKIHDHPTVVALTTTAPRRLASYLAGQELVVGVEIDEEERVVARTDHAVDFYRRLPQWLLAEDLPVAEIQTLDDSLQAVFDYLVGEG